MTDFEDIVNTAAGDTIQDKLTGLNEMTCISHGYIVEY